MAKYNHEQEMGEVYATHLDMVIEIIQRVHPVAAERGLGRLEVAAALRDIADDLAAAREEIAKLRAAWPQDSTTCPPQNLPVGTIYFGPHGWWTAVGAKESTHSHTRDAAINAAAGIEEPRT
jgi:hypothetical protein